MKEENVAIVHPGYFVSSFMLSEYEIQIDLLMEVLEKAKISAEVVRELPVLTNNFSSFVFFSIGMKKHAEEIKTANPEKTVVVLTGTSSGNGFENKGVKFISKSNVRVYDEIRKIIKP